MQLIKKHVGCFGDSYISLSSKWINHLDRHSPNHEFEVYGKGGANLYYAIRQWQHRIQEVAPQHFEFVFFTLTWPQRLFSVFPYRNEQFCAFSELRPFVDDPNIVTNLDNQEFFEAIRLHQKYIYDHAWREFDHELEIRWIMELPQQYPDIKFVIIPNTEQSRELARRWHTKGVLLDFAFETLSNLETDSPGPMPINCGRWGHLNDENHRRFGSLMRQLMLDYRDWEHRVMPVDLRQFDIDTSRLDAGDVKL